MALEHEWKPTSRAYVNRWRLVRFSRGYYEEAKGPKGCLRLFKTQEAAQKAADKLNQTSND